ncbi:unnamed protein product [Menidia menidia]|uniref:(Atlantic silverside) hypothetical protein n=1 Tax=Menidia menidia TaxID=238744 RepID=A0A8S4AEC6_9TELE|nr:unnamed protein product [Menidia menidia]
MSHFHEQIPGLCWACKWTLKKVKKLAGPDATSEDIRAVLLKACDQIGKLKSMCRGFVKKNLDELVEELSTTDDVRTICVNLRACKPKGLMDLLFYQNDEDPSIKISKF